MNNPPDVTQDPKEYEEYAHGVHQHVKRYIMVGLTLLLFTGITVALSYVDFGTRKANIGVAMLVATLKAGLVAAILLPREAAPGRAAPAVPPRTETV